MVLKTKIWYMYWCWVFMTLMINNDEQNLACDFDTIIMDNFHSSKYASQ